MRIPVVDPQASGAGRRYLIDLQPSKIVCLGQNYRAHAAEMGKGVPSEPLLFLKAPSALAHSGEAIVRPSGYERVDFEGELALVISRRARRIRAAQALDYVLGMSCLNDVSVRDLQARDGQWMRAKSFDGFCPFGPVIRAGLDPSDLHLVSRVNGVVKQDTSTSDLIFPVPFVLEFITAHFTLEPGDIVSTGTPAGVGNLAPGDVVEIEIEGIGTLSSPVISEDEAAQGAAR
ncbi:MAG TPA: fumarylacetoacetate hydrolase family protein [Kofleriaceae bacterium]|nr:fumarylacetoacetate hydrolase family protein [Kofleriaceae bacterium]